MKKRILFFFIIFFFFSIFTNAQQLIRQSLNCLGSNTITNGILLRQTIGQSSNTTTVFYGNSGLRQGFQQPINGENIFSENEIILNVYPNPAISYFTIQISNADEVYSCTITDILGSVIYNTELSNNLLVEINCITWTPGVYLLNINNSNNRLFVKKLVKIQ